MPLPLASERRCALASASPPAHPAAVAVSQPLPDQAEVVAQLEARSLYVAPFPFDTSLDQLQVSRMWRGSVDDSRPVVRLGICCCGAHDQHADFPLEGQDQQMSRSCTGDLCSCRCVSRARRQAMQRSMHQSRYCL